MKDWSYIINHLGEERENYFNAVVPPIVQSSNFAPATVHQFAKFAADGLNNHFYTRGNNPTVEILRKKIAAMEGTDDALVFSSGSAAMSAAIISQVKAGDHILCIQAPYHFTAALLDPFLSRFGVRHSFVDATSIEDIEAAIQDNTSLLILESPNSLTFEIQDLEACASLAKKHDITTIIDNSYASPYYQNPTDYGIDIVVHSASKYISGHSDILLGIICANNQHIRKIYDCEFLTLGATASPNDAWLAIRGLRTLIPRLEQSSKTTLEVVQYLKKHPKVKQVLYPHDPDFPQYDLAKKYLKGSGGLFSVLFHCEELEKMEAFCNAMATTFALAVSWGGYEALQSPTCAFYKAYPDSPPPLPIGFVRYYCGLESPSFLIHAFKTALKIL